MTHFSHLPQYVFHHPISHGHPWKTRIYRKKVRVFGFRNSDWVQVYIPFSNCLKNSIKMFYSKISHSFVHLSMCGRQFNRQSQSKDNRQVENITRAESPSCLAMSKLEKQRPCPPRNLSSPSISLVRQFGLADISYGWSFGLDPLRPTPACR